MNQLPDVSTWPNEPYCTMAPIVELLLQHGNSLVDPERQKARGFAQTQGGWVAYLKKPIDFELVQGVFDLPPQVRLSREEETIFVERTWVAIEGPKKS